MHFICKLQGIYCKAFISVFGFGEMHECTVQYRPIYSYKNGHLHEGPKGLDEQQLLFLHINLYERIVRYSRTPLLTL